ncbi:MAG: DUF4296 domain-containing protein [Flavobacteriales bacterium]|nr:DUF4296 domain-containing protein [Flavobacteriales bacterium]
MRVGILALVFFLMACGEDKPEKPEGIMSSDEFTALMIDVQLIEGIRAQRIEVSENKGQAEAFLYADVLDKHGISREEFEKIFAYYMENPRSMELIYEQVLDSLNKLDSDIKQEFTREMKEEADSLQQIKDKRRDSLKAIDERK